MTANVEPAGELELGIRPLPILVVDDEAPMLAAIARTLRDLGAIDAVDDPRRVVDLIGDHEYAVVVSDFRMPGIDGLTLLATIRDRAPNTSRILLTAHADRDALERAINDVAVHRFLRKPWSNDTLRAVVREAIDQNRLRREHQLLVERMHQRNVELTSLNRELAVRADEGDRALGTIRQRWDTALDAIADPIIVVDGELRLRGINRAGVGLAGRGARDRQGTACHRALFGRASPCPDCPLGEGKGRIITGAGAETRIFDATAYPLPGEPPATLCLYRDVTQMVALERRAAHVEKMAALGRLAGSMAHELNNPLHAILTFVQLAAQPETSAERLVRYHEVIRESAIRCSEIVRSLRDFSRREVLGERNAVELCQAVARALVLFRAMNGRRIELCERGGPPAWTTGNANQLHQVIVNLVQNAIDASPEGGRVTVEVLNAGDEVGFAVDDQGPGVPPSLRETIFEPFFTTKPEGVGTGLGLAISHAIVAEHGGTIRVHRNDDGGARFEVHLPTAQAPTELSDGSLVPR